MFKSVKVKGVMRRGKSSLIAKLTLTFVVFIVLMNVAQLTGTALSRHYILEGYFMKQVQGKMATVEQLTRSHLDELDAYVTSLPLVYTQVGDLLTAGDYQAVGHFLADNVRARGLQGYALMDSKFNLVGTSYTSYTKIQLDQLRELMRYVATTPEKKYTGSADVMGTGVGIVTVHVWQDSEGRDAAYAMVCYDSVENDGYLIRMAAFIQSEQSFYRGRYISATTYDGHDIDIHGLPIPQDWVIDSLKVKRENILMPERAGADDVFSAYIPHYDYKGELIGIHHIWLDQDVQAEVGRKMRKSVIIVSAVLSALFIWLFSIFLRRSVIRPLHSLRDDAERIASGDLSRVVSVPRTRDEIEQLAESMATMRDSLRGAMEMMSRTGAVIHVSSDNIGRASERLSDIASRQAGSLQEVAANLEEMSGNVTTTANNAAETNHLMSDASSALTDIAAKASECLANTRKVVGALRAIHSLVSQTNILALNASVEAARAGSQGRGFAVVAKSVGGLAEQTKRAAEDMAATTQTSIDGVENINKLIDDLVAQLRGVADSMSYISSAGHAQGSALEQITCAAETLNGVTTETAADAEELAASASELANLALGMKNQLDCFRL